MNKPKIFEPVWDLGSPDFTLQITKDGCAKAIVECCGLWNDDYGWYTLYSGDLFWTPSRAVALAELQEANEVGLRVRSFDEWAESEGIAEL